MREEFERQLQTLLDNDYPSAAGLTKDELVDMVTPLQQRLDDVPRPSHDKSLPLAIVIPASLVPTTAAMEKVVGGSGRSGVVAMTPVGPEDFAPRPGTVLPDAPVYLIADIDTGEETLNVTPEDAITMIEGKGRLPLTIDEGVAIMTQFPDVLRTHNAFQLLASRRADARIPSIWTSHQQPRLGWCWNGNPHTWMGSASAAARLA